MSDIELGSIDPTEAGDALVCVTENTACCRTADGAARFGVGEWFINRVAVPGIAFVPNATVFRNRGTGLVRLNVQSGDTLQQVGEYCCEIPDNSGVTQRLCLHGVTGELSN